MGFVTLCEVFLRIQPHFGLWKYFFLARTGAKQLPVANDMVMQIRGNSSA
jgi:hypothetical protein